LSDVLIKKEKFYYTVKLNRPEKRNAFTPDMIKELTEFFRMAEKDKFAGAVILSGEGDTFCAGGDLKWMQSMVNFNLEENKRDATALFELYESAAKCTLPIIGFIRGHAFGGGLGLTAICDVAIAEMDTQFCFSEVKLGLVPAVISSFILNKMAPNKAKELMITGQVFDAKIAYEAGLVEYVGRELECQDYLNAVIHRISENGREACREVKRLISHIRYSEPKNVKEECINVISKVRIGDEAQEGLKSFLEKRKPAWVWATSDEEEN
jgi:methylglutaconyl-CoA hydratase